MTQTKMRRKAQVEQAECVSCGTCVKVCPKTAIHIHKGIYAAVDHELCVGCRKCMIECPASVINMIEVAV